VTPEARLLFLRAVTDAQASDPGLWFAASTAVEAYLQQELRRLHAVIEHYTEYLVEGAK
jgi:hypothetical protein